MLSVDLDKVKGFLDREEGERLYQLGLEAALLGPVVEIGSYCGKSTVWLGTACRERNQLLYAIDHHRGSEEHQPGEEWHDPDLYDAALGRVDSLPTFRHTLHNAGLEQTVVPMVTSSALAARHWRAPVGMVFIDGGHSAGAALTDYRCWAGHIAPGGLLAIHDVFPDPADGGRPPFDIWQLAQASGLFRPLPLFKTLGVLVRL